MSIRLWLFRLALRFNRRYLSRQFVKDMTSVQPMAGDLLDPFIKLSAECPDWELRIVSRNSEEKMIQMILPGLADIAHNAFIKHMTVYGGKE